MSLITEESQRIPYPQNDGFLYKICLKAGQELMGNRNLFIGENLIFLA